MPTNLSIKNVPEDIAERLRQRAAKNHRSLQGELMAIIEAASLAPKDTPLEILEKRRGQDIHAPSDSMEILEKARRLGIKSSESSVDFIRADRDRHQPS